VWWRTGTVSAPDDRMAGILRQLDADGPERSGTLRLCTLATDLTGVTGASIMLLSDELARGSLSTTDGVAECLDDLQFTLGEGPALDAHAGGRPVAEPDFCMPVTVRWPVLLPPAIEAGVRAMFAFPVRIGAVRLGALALYRTAPGPLTDLQHADGLAMALVAARAILAMQADAPPGSVSEELESGANLHFVVHQAAGMVSVQLGIGVTEALVRLRAHAFLSDRAIDDVCRDVVDRILRFGDPAEA